MSVIDVQTSLGEMVNAHPSLAREFERRDLDYCCGGERSLAEACEAVGLDAAVLAEELARAIIPGEAEPWATMDMVELVDHIESVHHRYLWDELPRLDALVAKISGVHGARHPELKVVTALFGAIRAELEPHMVKEEQVLFPFIRELATAESLPAFHCGSVVNPITMMTHDHDQVGTLLGELRTATDDYRVPADGCVSYRLCFEGLAELEADTHLHVHKENNVLFPAALQRERALAASESPRAD